MSIVSAYETGCDEMKMNLEIIMILFFMVETTAWFQFDRLFLESLLLYIHSSAIFN